MKNFLTTLLLLVGVSAFGQGTAIRSQNGFGTNTSFYGITTNATINQMGSSVLGSLWTLLDTNGLNRIAIVSTNMTFRDTNNIQLRISPNGVEAVTVGFVGNGAGLTNLSVNQTLWGTNAVDGSITNVNGGNVRIGLGFGNDGTLTSSAEGSIVAGLSGMLGTIESTAGGAIAHGSVTASGTISASGQGSFSGGFNDSGQLSAANSGAFAHGNISADGSIQAQNSGSVAVGSVEDTSSIISSGDGAFAGGFTVDDTSTINSSSEGSFAYGRASTAGSLLASADAAIAVGQADDSTIEANGTAAFAGGYAASTGTINASTDASFAFGYADGGSVTAQGQGSVAHGHAVNGGTVDSSGNGSFAVGFADNTTVEATGDGSVAAGVGPLTASSLGSIALGVNAFATSDYSVVLNLDPGTAVTSPAVSTFTIRATNGVYLDKVWWSTNLASDVTIDYSRDHWSMATNNNLSISGRTGFVADKYNQTLITITNSSAAVKTITMHATFQNMKPIEGNTLYFTNVAQLLVYEQAGFGTNFYFTSR